MTQRLGRHTDTPANDVAALAGEWHIGRYWPGMFPFLELGCPCPKTPCGLVAPVDDITCAEHHGRETIRQAHPADTCGTHKRMRRLPVIGLIRRREPATT